ncbi:hypothetical protein XELAEV_18041373mg [Xenopus laevis]|uniref:Uncharacterized protein n=1 Tax=Xenopus laevis TaxID=8355 RepID=A0A974H523_XENLA|nr:hypothetical protein XELAEV_18041373mg [Xenopus laevis]
MNLYESAKKHTIQNLCNETAAGTIYRLVWCPSLAQLYRYIQYIALVQSNPTDGSIYSVIHAECPSILSSPCTIREP